MHLKVNRFRFQVFIFYLIMSTEYASPNDDSGGACRVNCLERNLQYLHDNPMSTSP